MLLALYKRTFLPQNRSYLESFTYFVLFSYYTSYTRAKQYHGTTTTTKSHTQKKNPNKIIQKLKKK